MAKTFSVMDLSELRSMAIAESNSIPPRSRLPGMFRDLDTAEQAAVAWYKACLSMLNSKGAIKEGWIDPIVPTVELEQPDNGVVVDGIQAFDLVDRKRRP